MLGSPVMLGRWDPPTSLANIVEHLWVVRWELPDGEMLEQSTLPHPSLHWTIETGRSEIVGIVRGRFVRRLVGHGRVVAAKLRPAGFGAFTDQPLHVFTDRRVPAVRIFGELASARSAQLDALSDDAAAEWVAEALVAFEPTLDEKALFAQQSSFSVATMA